MSDINLHESYLSIYEGKESGSPRPTFMPKSRERDIGKHDDWKDKPTDNWEDKTTEQKKADKLRRRASSVVQTQRRQDRETSVKEDMDLYDVILAHLLDEGYAESVEQAEAIMVNMSEDWRESIVEATYKPRGAVEPIEPADTRKVVTRMDQKGNTQAWKNYQAGDKSYKAASHLQGV